MNLRTRAELLCRAIMVSFNPGKSVTGIVGCTEFGERWPETWSSGDRVRPRDFGKTTLNSIIGHCSVELSLTGPQILLVGCQDDQREVDEIARQQISAGRADQMLVVCHGDRDLSVTLVRH